MDLAQPVVNTYDERINAVSGKVVGIFVYPVKEGPAKALESAEVQAGKGLVGDRYFEGKGTYSDRPPSDGLISIGDSIIMKASLS